MKFIAKQRIEQFRKKRAEKEQAKIEAIAAEHHAIVERQKSKRQEQLEKIDTLDIESIGSIDGTAFAKSIKQFAERLSKMPLNKPYMSISTAIHMLCAIIEKMPQFKEDKRE